ncbi:MAG: citrate/2-methylcitrate synthase [Spirochaetes bacterium]|nr:citrate/2-methylcitrate synthase [Spirochaetota bacterium]
MVEITPLEREFLEKYSKHIMRKKIPMEYYSKYNVKRGLRNSDGTGVLVGLTEIGEVHGYIKNDEDKIPDHGKMIYRGIDLQDLVKGFQSEERFGFEETAYLLMFAELPNKEELESYTRLVGENRLLPPNFTEDMILKAPSNDIMNKLARAVLASYSYDDDADDTSILNILRQSTSLISRIPTMMAYAYQAKRHYYDGKSLFLHAPEPDLSTAENILRMIRSDKEYEKFEAEILDLCLVLHAEHGGGNNSTFTTHVVSSTGTDTYSAIAASIGSLKGPLHGGANNKVMSMMDNIKENVKDWSNETEVSEYIKKILRKEAYNGTGLVYGMGHAVYTLSDPRAILLKEQAVKLAEKKGLLAEYHLYELIEKITPDLFCDIKNTDKRISANVDFYSGFVYSMLGIGRELFTPLFAVSRITGWCAHRLEEVVNGGKIIRPAFKSVSKRLNYTPLGER